MTKEHGLSWDNIKTTRNKWSLEFFFAKFILWVRVGNEDNTNDEIRTNYSDLYSYRESLLYLRSTVYSAMV